MRTVFKFISILLLFTYYANSQSTINKIDSILQTYHKEHPEIGISIGFIQDQMEYYTSFGSLSRESEIKINRNAVFEIASITKLITSHLIAKAALENRLNVGDYMDKYLPAGFILQDSLKNRVRISDLASHQSGLPDVDFRKLIEIDPQQPIAFVTLDTVVSMINKCSNLSDYGEYRYSTIGYTLLGLILENVYDMTYENIIMEKLINPLQLTNTYTTQFNVDNRTTGYNAQGGVQEFFNWNIMASAGLIKSSTSDMMIYLKHILDEGSTLSKAAKLSEEVYYQSDLGALGLGTNIMKDGDQTLYLKSGDSMGQSSMLCYNRENNWGIIIFLNQNNSKLRNDLLNDIYEYAIK